MAAFLAKYSQLEADQVSCIQKTSRLCFHDMPRHFYIAVLFQAASTALRKLITEKILTMDSEKSRRTIFRRRNHIHKQLRDLEWFCLGSIGYAA